MEKFIIWSNLNNGFISTILSVLTLIVSIIAIITSIHTSRLPYKKKVLLEVGSYFGTNTKIKGIYINAINIGNRQIKISKLGFKIKDRIYMNFKTINKSQILLKQGELTSQYFNTNEFKKISNINVSEKTKIYAYMQDTEGKEYKKFAFTLSEFKNTI